MERREAPGRCATELQPSIHISALPYALHETAVPVAFLCICLYRLPYASILILSTLPGTHPIIMARKTRHSKPETRTARLKLAVRRKPYNGPSLARGVQLHYRRNKTNGTWVLKASDGHGKYWTKAFAEADDFDEANGGKVLTFFQAQDTAKKLARGDG